MDWSLIFSNAIRNAISINAIAYASSPSGLKVHFGYTGLLNFGQAAFVACGAYAIAIPVSRTAGRSGPASRVRSPPLSSWLCCWASPRCGCAPTTWPS